MSARTRPITTTAGTRPFAFSEAALAECRAIIARYPQGRSKSALIPILHIAQAENDGWLSVNAMDAVAHLLINGKTNRTDRANRMGQIKRALQLPLDPKVKRCS